MSAPNIPAAAAAAGISQEQFQQIMSFMATLPAARPPRPSLVMTPSQMRGVNPNYKHVHREYPKALNPPEVAVKDRHHEAKLRLEWKTPLPWNAVDDKEVIEGYYTLQEYPKTMAPPQIIVNSEDEEEQQISAWRAAGRGAGANYPRFMFHPKLPAVRVASLAERNSLGAGWYDSADEAIVAIDAEHDAPAGATQASAEPADPAKMNRNEMFAWLAQRGIPAKLPKSNDELRIMVLDALTTPTEAQAA